MPETLITLGSLLLFGLLTFWLGSITALPRVTLLILMGVLIGPSGLDLFQETREFWFKNISILALVMVGFLLGSTLTRATFKLHGTQIVGLSLGAALITLAVVSIGLLAFSPLPLEAALLLAAIATATDPIATVSVINELKNNSQFSKILVGVVALDDAWGLLIFSLCLTVATSIGSPNDLPIFVSGLWEIMGALLLGVAVGLPMAFLSGRIHEGEPTLIEALGLVCLCGGLALWLEVSYLLAAMAMGATVANLATHHTRPFHAIRNIQSPFLVLFFILAGASLNLGTFMDIGLIGGLYIVLRLIGKIVGGWTAGRLFGMSGSNARWMGAAMLPQAGVAVGMALIVGQLLPEHADTILTVTIAATALFEIVGPVATRAAIRRCK
ncbi:MAG TPA: cation:proton antiporter [Porticoccus sp.]|nr:cation:proton antiporter [Porticoccus sp.]